MQEMIAVYSEDPEFSENLCRKLRDRGRIPCALKAFDTREALEEYVNSHPDTYVLLDRQAADAALMKLLPGRVIYLTDVRGYPRIDNIRTVFKYQALSGIETELLEGLREETEGPQDSGSALFTAKYIGVVSPVGRSLKTSFCLTLGQLLAQKEHVLYIDLEPCSGFRALFEKEFPKDLSDLLYAYETGKRHENAADYTEQFHGLDFIAPVLAPEDIYRTDPAVLLRVITELQRSGAYDTVILDLACDYRHAEALIPICRKLYLPVRKDLLSEAKMAEFKAWLERISDGSRLRTEEVVLPFHQTFSTGKQYLEQLLWSELGDHVRTMLRSGS